MTGPAPVQAGRGLDVRPHPHYGLSTVSHSPSARRVVAVRDASIAVVGGEPIGHRFLWWNLVHSDFDRVQQQAERWRRGDFPVIPGDNAEVIAAPPGPLRGRR